MNDFFSNLLHRHQSTCDVAEPRPFSRFESEGFKPDGSSEVAAIQTDLQEKPLLRSSQNPTLETKQNKTVVTSDPSVPPKPPDTQPARPTDLSPERPDQFNPHHRHIERTASETHEIRKPKTKERTNGSASPMARPELQTIELRQTGPIAIAQSRMVDHCSENESAQQVKKTLARLHRHRTDSSPEQTPRHAKTSRQAVHEEEAGSTEKRPSTAQPQRDPAKIVVPAGDLKILPSEIHAAEEPVREDTNLSSDRLKPPFWVSRLAAQMRDQEMKSPPATPNEPVVNVTIGRVEVRAVPTEKTRRRPERKKFSGVMSLNHYLKQREQAGST